MPGDSAASDDDNDDETLNTAWTSFRYHHRARLKKDRRCGDCGKKLKAGNVVYAMSLTVPCALAEFTMPGRWSASRNRYERLESVTYRCERCADTAAAVDIVMGDYPEIGDLPRITAAFRKLAK